MISETFVEKNVDKLIVSRVSLFCRPEDVQALISGKLALRYAGRQVYKLTPLTTLHHHTRLGLSAGE